VAVIRSRSLLHICFRHLWRSGVASFRTLRVEGQWRGAVWVPEKAGFGIAESTSPGASALPGLEASDHMVTAGQEFWAPTYHLLAEGVQSSSSSPIDMLLLVDRFQKCRSYALRIIARFPFSLERGRMAKSTSSTVDGLGEGSAAWHLSANTM
jgi:hypothetical protein